MSNEKQRQTKKLVTLAVCVFCASFFSKKKKKTFNFPYLVCKN